MSDPMTLALSPEWKERLGLANRQAPELYDVSASVVDAPHASAIRVALDDLQVSAVFCVQTVPTIAILVTDNYDRKAIVDLHGALWNQGLISLLLVISGEVMRAFSLARTPLKDADEAFENRCLVDTLTLTADALRFRNIVDGAESGRLWSEHAEYFKPKERIDQVLLDNLKVSHTLLRKEGLDPDPAQALLIQAMFIAYLEDRDIISTEYFRTVSSGAANSSRPTSTAIFLSRPARSSRRYKRRRSGAAILISSPRSAWVAKRWRTGSIGSGAMISDTSPSNSSVRFMIAF